eukprot:523146_1
MILILLFMLIYSSKSAKEKSPILMKIKNLNGLSAFTPEYADIFTPQYTDENKQQHKHDVHVIDQFGKYMKLYYEAKHPLNTFILKMDEKIHKTNIEAIVCKHDADNSIELYFKYDLIANEYMKQIESTLNNPEKTYFITAGHEWGCTNPNGRYESILRKVIRITKTKGNRKTFTLLTQPAELVDIFEKLDLKFTTNVGMHQHRVYNNYNTKYITHTQSRRKLIWKWITDIATSVVYGIKAVEDKIIATVTTIADYAEKIVKYTLGKPVDFNKESEYTWSWNYDFETNAALRTFDLTKKKETNTASVSVSKVGCTNCYAYAKLEFSYSLHIDNYMIQSCQMLLNGQSEINIDITGNTQMNASMTLPTPELPIPAFSFSIAGFKFGVFISAQIEIGAVIHVDKFALQFNAHGEIKKGFVYDRMTHTQNYINQHEFRYNRTGPRLKFKSTNVTIYAEPALYLTLEHVGSFYYGIQPRLTLLFEKNERLSESSCGLYVTSTFSLQPFIGVDINILGFKWKKKIQFNAIQSTLSNWGGCIEQAKITQIQTIESDVTYYHKDNWTDYNWSQSSGFDCAYVHIIDVNSTSWMYPIGEYYCTDYVDESGNHSFYYTCQKNQVYVTTFDQLSCFNIDTAIIEEVDSETILDYNCDGEGSFCDVAWAIHNLYEYDPIKYNINNLNDTYSIYNACEIDLYRSNFDSITPIVIDFCSYGQKFYCNNYGFLDRNSSSNLDCTNSTLTTSWLGIGYGLFEQDDTVSCTVTPYCNDYDHGYDDGYRRRMQVNGGALIPNLKSNAVAFVDMTDLIDTEYRSISGWGSFGTQWWSNMSIIDEICDDWVQTCVGINGTIPIIVPDNATLLIHVINDSSLIGLYQTYITITQNNGWNMTNVTIYTNISCTTRHQLTLRTKNEHDDIPTFDVKMLEW